MDIRLDELQTAVHTLRAAPAAALVTRVRSDTRCRVLFWHAIRQPHRLPLSATTTAARHKTDGRRLEAHANMLDELQMQFAGAELGDVAMEEHPRVFCFSMRATICADFHAAATTTAVRH